VRSHSKHRPIAKLSRSRLSPWRDRYSVAGEDAGDPFFASPRLNVKISAFRPIRDDP